MSEAFGRLAPFIREYIYDHHWEELRDIPVRAIEAVLDTPNHVLISSGTASGKTEAAFFPILTELIRDLPDSFGVIYIGPLKALINDQFKRLQALIDQAGIPQRVPDAHSGQGVALGERADDQQVVKFP